MMVSFCISCKNRLHQISKTLKKNLLDNIDFRNEVEFILVDFDSRDGLQNWIIRNFEDELNTGYLKYFITNELEFWHMSIAKNTTHNLACGDILVNLDCDNFTGKNGALYVQRQFSTYGKNLILHQTSGNPRDGSHGRIAVKADYFHLIGGYDESFDPMGYQDVDFIKRLVASGLIYVPKCSKAYTKAVPNSKSESIRYVESAKTYLEMCTQNRLMSGTNLKRGKIIANNGLSGIKKNVFQYPDIPLAILKNS